MRRLPVQVIYQLCACSDTSGPTMRYLRTSQDFLFSHLQHLPFILPGESHVNYNMQVLLDYFHISIVSHITRRVVPAIVIVLAIHPL